MLCVTVMVCQGSRVLCTTTVLSQFIVLSNIMSISTQLCSLGSTNKKNLADKEG